METLVLNFKSKKNYKLIKELALRLEGNANTSTSSTGGKIFPKKKLTEKALRAMGGIAKGQLISKERLRALSWKKRNW
jgi:hypothetical protein